MISRLAIAGVGTNNQPIDHYLSTEYSVFLWRIYSGVYGVNVGDGEKDSIVRGFGAKTLWSFPQIERKKDGYT